MKPLTITFLSVSGLLLLAIGGTILFVPHAFYASDGIILGNDPNLLSESAPPAGCWRPVLCLSWPEPFVTICDRWL